MRAAAGSGVGRRHVLAVVSVLAFLLTLFLVAAALGMSVLDDPTPMLTGGGWEAAALAVTLLVADALLPVPASVVMISLGALYGPVWGIALSLLGRFAMGVAGFAIGRRGGPLLRRAIPAERERIYAEQLVERWGGVAIVLSRPVPLLAETTMLLAGAAGLRWRVALAAAFVGAVPEAVAYGLIGAYAASAENGVIVWIGFLFVAGVFRLIERRLARAGTRPQQSAASVVSS